MNRKTTKRCITLLLAALINVSCSFSLNTTHTTPPTSVVVSPTSTETVRVVSCDVFKTIPFSPPKLPRVPAEKMGDAEHVSRVLTIHLADVLEYQAAYKEKVRVAYEEHRNSCR